MLKKTNIQIEIDEKVYKEANELFNTLGLDIDTAINIFLHKSVLINGLPFEIDESNYKKKVIDSMKEAKEISKNPNVKSYSSFEEVLKSLDN